MGGKGEGLSRNMYKGHVDKLKEGRIEGRRWDCLVCGGVVGRKWRQLYLNNNKKREREKEYYGNSTISNVP